MTRKVTDEVGLKPRLAPGPLFVLSVPRSGSSLFYALLNQHSKIALLYEGDLPKLQLFLRGQFRGGDWRERWEFWNQGPSRNGIAINLMPASVSDVWEATRIVYQNFARSKQATIWGEKTPHWYDCPLQMADRFSEARYIFLWRDMNAVMGSIARAARGEHAFARLSARPANVLLGNERLRHACDVLKAQGRPVHELNYEDLITNPIQRMEQVCQFLEIEVEPRVATLEGADRSAICSGQHHALVRGNEIVSARSSASYIDRAQQAKVARYVCRWKRASEGKWPKYPVELPTGTRPVPLPELWRDRSIDAIAAMWEKLLIIILHQLRPLFYRKRYIRSQKALP